MAEGSAHEQLGLPWRERTPQVEGRRAEKRMARDRGARLHPNSGAGRIKDDASNDDTIFEFKNVSRTHTLKGKDLLGLFWRALRQGKEARYVVYFEDEDITVEATITKGRKQ